MIERYQHSEHRRHVEAWLSARGIPVPPPEMFPPTGFVVDNVAAGFLHKTDSKICYVDQVVTRPGLNDGDREAALTSLLSALACEAKSAGYWLVTACPRSANMVSRFRSLDFDTEGTFTLVHKTLLEVA